MPGIRRLVEVVDLLLVQRHNIPALAPRIPIWLDTSGYFQEITVRSYSLPIGDWHGDPEKKALGNDFRNVWVRYADSLRPMLAEPSSGLNEAEINDLIAGYLDDLRNVPGMVGKYHTVYAKKI
jgi:hypothetical protein